MHRSTARSWAQDGDHIQTSEMIGYLAQYKMGNGEHTSLKAIPAATPTTTATTYIPGPGMMG